MVEVIQIGFLSDINYPDIFIALDSIGKLHYFNCLDSLQEMLFSGKMNIVILDSSYITKQNIAKIKNLTLGKAKLIGILNIEDIHKAQLGLDDFILRPMNHQILITRVQMLFKQIPVDIIPTHIFDNEIIGDCISKFTRIQMHIDMKTPAENIYFLIKNIEWNLRLLELLHCSIRVNLVYVNSLLTLTENLMRLYNIKIHIKLVDDMVSLPRDILQEIAIKVLCLCRFTAHKSEYVNITVDNGVIFHSIDIKYSNTYSSRLLKFCLDTFTKCPVTKM